MGNALGYTYDGAAYCADCGRKSLDMDDPEVSAFFSWDCNNPGTTCDGCGACLDDQNNWEPPDVICDPRYYQWPRCAACNHTEPRHRLSARERLELAEEACPCCGRGPLKLERRGPWAGEHIKEART